MISSDEQSGLFTFLVGIIVLVMAGVGLSLLVDKRFRFSSDRSSNEAAIRVDAGEIEDLGTMLEGLRTRIARESPARERAAGSQAETRARINHLESRLSELRSARAAAESGLAALEEAFASYRENHRRAEWARSVGESLGTLTVRGGKEYRQAVISRVTDAGLEIRHEHGMARVQAPDLDPALRDRFQWDDARRARLLAEERGMHQRVAPQPGETHEEPRPAAGSARRPAPPPSPDVDALAKARNDVRLWQSRMLQLKSDHRAALANSSRGSASVPGSLETWSARAARLGADLTRARAALTTARQTLARLDPGDPLLKSDPDDR